MNRPLKLAVTVIGAFVGIVLLLAVTIALLFDPNDYREEIQASVEDATGRTLTIDGELELSLFPWLGMQLGHTELSDAEGFGDEPMLAVDAVLVRLKLLPLLSKRIEADRIVLAGLNINLRVDESGRNNWQDLASGDGQVEADEPAAASDEGSSLRDFQLGGLEIRDAVLLWDDASSGQRAEISDLNVETGAIRPGEPVSFEMTLGFENAEPAVSGTLSMNGNLEASSDFGRFTVPNLQLSLAATGAGMGGLDAVDLTVDVDDLVADLNAERHSLVRMTARVGADGADLPSGRLDATMAVSAVEADLQQDTLRVTEIALNALGLSLTADLTGDSISTNPVFSGRMAVAPFSPRALLESIGTVIETTDPQVLANSQFNAHYNVTPDSLNLDDLSLVLDDTAVTGSFGIADLNRQALRFQLAVDAIDADRYMPPVAEGETPSATADASPLDDIPLPGELIRGLDVDGTLTIGRLTVMGLRATDVAVGVRAVDDVLALTQLRAQLYEGSLQGSARVDASGEVPAVQLRDELRGVQIHDLLTDFAEIEDITGITDMRVDLSGEGATVGALKRSLDGEVSMAMSDVVLNGFDLWYAIRQASAQVTGGGDPGVDRGETRITAMSMSSQAVDGLFSSDDLSARLPFLNLTGVGSVDLASALVDYDLQVLVVRNPELEGDPLAEALYDVPVPVEITGPYDDFEQMSISPGIEAVLAAKARQRIDEEVEDLEDQVKDRLRSLFGRDG
jgi:AsmA protein